MSIHRGEPVELVEARVERFNDQEIFVEVHENVRGEDMFIIQPTSNPANDNLMELLIIADTLRRSSAARITAVIPYFGYARQDRRTRARTPISAKLVANMITQSGIERVLTMDLHAAQIQGFFDIPVDNLYASPVFALDIKHHFEQPRRGDGGLPRCRRRGPRARAGQADRRRRSPSSTSAARSRRNRRDDGDRRCQGQRCIIIDDICDTAGTLVKAAELLSNQGAKEVHAYISHGVMSGPAVERVTSSSMKSLVITDTIEPTAAVRAAPNIRVVPTAPIFAQAILNIWSGTSVSSLFDSATLEPIYEALYPNAA